MTNEYQIPSKSQLLKSKKDKMFLYTYEYIFKTGEKRSKRER
jgi:hypothetical protein